MPTFAAHLIAPLNSLAAGKAISLCSRLLQQPSNRCLGVFFNGAATETARLSPRTEAVKAQQTQWLTLAKRHRFKLYCCSSSALRHQVIDISTAKRLSKTCSQHTGFDSGGLGDLLQLYTTAETVLGPNTDTNNRASLSKRVRASEETSEITHKTTLETNTWIIIIQSDLKSSSSGNNALQLALDLALACASFDIKAQLVFEQTGIKHLYSGSHPYLKQLSLFDVPQPMMVMGNQQQQITQTPLIDCTPLSQEQASSLYKEAQYCVRF